MSSPPTDQATDQATDQGATSQALFTFRSGGWVLVATGVLTVVIAAVILSTVVGRLRDRPPGDGRDPATYGFDLATCLVPRDQLVTGQFHRDLVPPLVDPPTVAGGDVDTINRERRGKFMVPGDRVIGVTVGGESRAYPLRMLRLHEVVNDRLGGEAILVTYNPLCDSAVVCERGAAEFGTSGLLFNSNMLLYDRQAEPSAESLWVQLQRRAVTGPAAVAERQLKLVPAVLTSWNAWLEAHPGTTVLAPNPELEDRYKETNYDRYFLSEELLFPVDPPAPEDGPAAKTRCVVVFAGSGHRVYPVPYVAERSAGAGGFVDRLDGVELRFVYRKDAESVEVAEVIEGGDSRPARVVYCLWFAWHAMSPESEVAGWPRTMPGGP